MHVIIDLECPICGTPLRVETRNSVDVLRLVCRSCGAVVTVKLQLAVSAEQVSKAMLDEYERWLVARVGVMKDTARRYRRELERYLFMGRWPKIVAPIEYWERFKTEYYSRQRGGKLD